MFTQRTTYHCRGRRRDFVDVWIPAQERAARLGIAPRVIKYKVYNDRISLTTEKVEGQPILTEVMRWLEAPGRDREEKERYLGDIVGRLKNLLNALVTMTGWCYQLFTEQIIRVRPDGRLYIDDFADWTIESPPEVGHEEMVCRGVSAFCSWIMCCMKHDSVEYRCVERLQAEVYGRFCHDSAFMIYYRSIRPRLSGRKKDRIMEAAKLWGEAQDRWQFTGAAAVSTSTLRLDRR
jgi:hypothetical protein